jgi:uncharacterized phage protein (TIGR02218 family)
MRQLPSGMQDHLSSGATTLCWCWKLTRRDGLTMGFTDHDVAVPFDTVAYEADSGFTATQIQSSLGLSVDNLDVAGALSSSAIKEVDIAAGLYDGADVEIWRVNWANPDQRLLVRKGRLGEISRGETYFSAEVRGLAAELQQKQGRVFQSGCDADFCDCRCGGYSSDPAFRVDVSVVGYSGGQVVHVSGAEGFDAGWFNRGTLTFTSGANAGLSYMLQSHQITSEIVTVGIWSSFLKSVAIGDGLTLIAGCDKRFATCVKRFGNGSNFRGFPHMPGNDFVATYPKPDDDDLSGTIRYDQY